MSEGRFDTQFAHLQEHWREFAILNFRFKYLMVMPYVLAVMSMVITQNAFAALTTFMVTWVFRAVRLRPHGGQLAVARWLGQMREYRQSFIEGLNEVSGFEWMPFRWGVRTTCADPQGGHLVMVISFVGTEDGNAVGVGTTRSKSERHMFPTVGSFLDWLGQPA